MVSYANRIKIIKKTARKLIDSDRKMGILTILRTKTQAFVSDCHHSTPSELNERVGYAPRDLCWIHLIF